MGFFDFLKDSNNNSSSNSQSTTGWYDVENGKVVKYTNANSRSVVYSQSPKAVKALLSPDNKNVLILRENGSVVVMSTSTRGVRTVYNEVGNLAAKDIVWDGNRVFQVKLNNGWRKKSL